MEVDMLMFDCEMRLEDLEHYMFEKSAGEEMAFYHQHGQHHHQSGGESWHINNITVNGKEVLEEGPFYGSACSPTLSRSSSHVSTGSDNSSTMSFDNNCYNPPHCQSDGIFVSHSLTNFCSPLSDQLIRNCNSLQSFDSVDSHQLLSLCDMVVHNSSSGNEDLSINSGNLSLEAMLGIQGGLDLPAVHDHGQYGDWTTSPESREFPPADKPEIYGSSPVSVLDFGSDEDSISPRADVPRLHFFDGPPQYSHEDHHRRSEDSTPVRTPGSSTNSVSDFNTDGTSIQGFGGDNHSQSLQQLMRSEPCSGNNNDSDLFYQHLSSQISFVNCHTAHSLGFQPQAVPELGIKTEEDINGIRVVHLLLAGAEAVASLNVDLATVILVRLKELVSRTGSTMQRVAACFCEGLQFRIEGVKGPEKSLEPQNDSLTAFQVLHEVSPYIKFAHFTANQAILEAVEGERRVHIMDYDILEGIQWPSLMQALACRPGGPPHLRITAVCRPHIKRALAMTQETGKRLSEFAATFNIPFSFHQVRVDNEDEFRPTLLKQVKGECLAVNCMLHLPHMPHRSQKPVQSFMKIIHRLSPKVLTLVEEELSCRTPTFASHFFEALHHYSAIFDSLEATLPAESKGRQLVEKIFLAPRIASLMTSSNSDGKGGDHMSGPIQWHSLAQAAGFHPVPLSVYNSCQARLLLGLFSDGYKVEEDKNRLLLGWRSKILVGASVWNCA